MLRSKDASRDWTGSLETRIQRHQGELQHITTTQQELLPPQEKPVVCICKTVAVSEFLPVLSFRVQSFPWEMIVYYRSKYESGSVAPWRLFLTDHCRARKFLTLKHRWGNRRWYWGMWRFRKELETKVFVNCSFIFYFTYFQNSFMHSC